MTDCFYHYTDAETALKILTKKELWMTHISYLNDTQEGKDLRKYLIPKIDSPEIYKILDYIDSHYESYVCSFSKNGDLLSQWRGYCPKDEGYAIGFKQPEDFKSLTNRNGKEYFQGDKKEDKDYFIATWQSSGYEECIYCDKEKKNISKELAPELEQSYEAMPQNIKNIANMLPEISENLTDFHNYLSRNEVWIKYYRYFSILFKDESFQEEKEYRLFITFKKDYQQNPCYRVRNGVFIPYYRFCFTEKLFQEVRMRKTSHDELTEKGLKHFLKHRKKMTDEDIKGFIEESNIPFRG